MITQDYQHFVLLFHSQKGEQNIVQDLTLEIYENFDVAKQVLSDYLFSIKPLFRNTAQIAHLEYPGVNGAIEDLISVLKEKTEQLEIIELTRNWIAANAPEKHIALSGFVYTCLRKALTPKKVFYCLVVDHFPTNLEIKKLSKVEISGGWVREILDDDSCPLMGCVPIGDEYVSWRLYSESTFVPILGFIDFCRRQKVLSIVEAWCQKHPESPESKVFVAIHQIENIEIARDSLFV